MVVVSKLYCEHALRDCMGCIGRCTETRCMAVVTAAIQTIHRTYLVPRPLYDHTAYTAILSHTAYTLYSPYTIQLTSPPLCGVAQHGGGARAVEPAGALEERERAHNIVHI